MSLTKEQRANIKRKMNEKHKITAALVHLPSRRDNDIKYELRYHDNGEQGGYHENHILVLIHYNGAWHLCGDPETEQIYLYPEQVKYLKQILKEKG